MHESTGLRISDIRRSVGRIRINYEDILGRFDVGTKARIQAALREGEKQADFIREAVERELKRRKA